MAITFNTDPKYANETNCFLKSGSGRFDAYQRSASGVIVESQGAAGTISFASIDATADVRARTNFAGYTIGGQLSGVNTVDGCRAACIGDDQCVAFSMKLSTRACFLKSAVGPSVADPDYLSATKRQMSVPPTMIPVDQ